MTQATHIVDSHVHFWDPELLDYGWLTDLEVLRRTFLPADFRSATAGLSVETAVFVQAECAPSQAADEVAWIAELAASEPWIAGTVAFAPVDRGDRAAVALERLAGEPSVRGVRRNIQGEPPGFAVSADFVRGVRRVGDLGLPFDICVTHDQVAEATALVDLCPGTRFVLDHCGKPPVRTGALDPWRARVRRLAERDHVWCKISGLATEADLAGWTDADLRPYVEHVLECFGWSRVMYGGDWPVVTLAGSYRRWFDTVSRLVYAAGEPERQRFYRENAVHFYALP